MILKGIKELTTFLETPRNIAIIGHRNPDGDALGSTLGLAKYFAKKNHKTSVIVPNDFPDFLSWLPDSNAVLKFDSKNEQSKDAINAADIVFLLDFNALHRVGKDMQMFLEQTSKIFAVIDHHQEPDDFTYVYSDTSICSTCQMVYHFIEMQSDLDLIDAIIATCLYTGIMTDTGSFRFRSTTSTTHRIIADLIDKGANNSAIHNNVYDANSHSRLLLLGQALTNLKVKKEYNTAYITLTEAEKSAFNFKKGDSEGVVNYALSIKGIVFAAIFIEDKEQDIIKISFRSKGRFSVNTFARRYFSGGGHDNAAGGKFDGSLAELITYFNSLLPSIKIDLKTSTNG